MAAYVNFEQNRMYWHLNWRVNWLIHRRSWNQTICAPVGDWRCLLTDSLVTCWQEKVKAAIFLPVMQTMPPCKNNVAVIGSALVRNEIKQSSLLISINKRSKFMPTSSCSAPSCKHKVCICPTFKRRSAGFEMNYFHATTILAACGAGASWTRH